MVNVTQEVLTLAFIFDNSSYEWGERIANYTIQMLNAKDDGWRDDVLADGTVLNWTYRNDNCDEADAASAYWDIRTELGNVPPHGIVGARCSSASVAVALVSSVDNVTQVSPVSSSSKLSDETKFPNFLRLVAPDDSRGQAGALKELLKSFGWERLSILFTDTQYSRDLATSFKSLWPERGIASNSEIRLNTLTKSADGRSPVDEESVRQALLSVPVDNPAVNSRIILLVADQHHAYEILRLAHERGFQEDTIWIGTDAWTGNDRIPEFFNTTNYRQGYLGLLPKMNFDREYQAYLRILNSYLRRDGIDEYNELPDYAAETMVDTILSFAMAFSKLAPEDRRNVELVTEAVRNLTFRGVNGPVAFTKEGDRANPMFSVFNAKATSDGKLEWVDVGSIGVNGSAAEPDGVQLDKICFVQPFGCNNTEAPSALYPVPAVPLPLWVWIVVPIIAVALLIVLYRYIRTKRKKYLLRKSFQAFQNEIRGIDATIEQGVKERQALIGARYRKPDDWDDVPDTNTVLVDVTPFKKEYWDVQARLQRDMPDARISRLWRVQNHSLWAFYTFHKDRFTMNGIANHNEREVWHGTTNLDPDVIYRDRHDGFMMQFARMGFWGRGLYFADQSSYSDMYSYKPTGASWQPTFSDRPEGEADEREMFLTKLLVGKVTKLAQNNSLIVPPLVDPAKPPDRYNTVTGDTGGSPVFIVYENGRAYPSYLVRYYRGSPDRKRTPFSTYDEAKDAEAASSTASPSSVGSTSDEGPALDLPAGDGGVVGGDATDDGADGQVRVTWEFYDNDGWTRYGDAHQAELEAAHRRGDSAFAFDTAAWSYEVNFGTMVQVNLDHPSHTRRKVRRLEVQVASPTPHRSASFTL